MRSSRKEACGRCTAEHRGKSGRAVHNERALMVAGTKARPARVMRVARGRLFFPLSITISERVQSSDRREDLDTSDMASKAQAAKEKGNAAFKSGDYVAAVGHYTEAILADKHDPTFFLNRAAAYLKLGKYVQSNTLFPQR